MQSTQTSDQREHQLLGLQLSSIGPYILRQIIGEGGMGAVYLADQTEPVQRKVAIKVTRVDLGSSDRLARFESERQILATLKHPHIAQVFGAGETPQGFPYMVMEYVNGLPISAFAASHKLSLSERLELMLQACQAIAHAHQNGVIHRDIKPSNLLVEQLDGRAQVKLIDFGIAKLVETANGQQTQTGHSIGTPQYMSPEQRRALADIDTRTDVYSLGLTLFQLLTGKLPEQVNPTRAPVDDQALETPSRCVAKSNDQELSHHYPAHVRRANLSASLRGELDWVVLKACAFDRTQRYGSVRELAADLQRVLANEPVFAAPPSRLYVLRKYVQRHRWQAVVALAMLHLIALTSTLVLHAWQRERVARSIADQQLRQHRAFNEFLLHVLTTVPTPPDGIEISLNNVLEHANSELPTQFKDDQMSATAMRLLLARVRREAPAQAPPRSAPAGVLPLEAGAQ